MLLQDPSSSWGVFSHSYSPLPVSCPGPVIFFDFSLQDGRQMPPRCHPFFMFFWHRFWIVFYPNLAPTWPPNPAQNSPKSHPKAISTCILFSIAFWIDFWWIVDWFSTSKKFKTYQKINFPIVLSRFSVLKLITEVSVSCILCCKFKNVCYKQKSGVFIFSFYLYIFAFWPVQNSLKILTGISVVGRFLIEIKTD